MLSVIVQAYAASKRFMPVLTAQVPAPVISEQQAVNEQLAIEIKEAVGPLLRSFSLVAVLLVMGLQPAFAQPEQPADCVAQGSEYHQVNPWIVRAILDVESRFNPTVMNKNTNGTVDVGMAQINSMHFKELRKLGVAPSDLMDGCVASYVAAWHLRKQIAAYGNTWFAIGAYHSATPCFNKRYTALVWNKLLTWRVVEGQRVLVQSMAACQGSNAASQKSKSSQQAIALTPGPQP